MRVTRLNKQSKFVLAIGLVLLLCSPAWAHSTEDHPNWTWPPSIVLPLFAAAALYILGTLKLARSSRAYRALPTIWFALGWLSLLLALDSPIHEIGEQLFWVHMTQHEILMLVSAPLIALGEPLVFFLRALPDGWRQRVSKISNLRPLRKSISVTSAPLSAWFLSAAALWIWHLPWLFDRAVESDWIHAAQHTTFFLSALLFWWPLTAKKPSMGYGPGILYIFTTGLHTSVLGALLTFAPRPWYHPYLTTAPIWHITAIEDQQLGGLIMWIPAGTLLLIVSLVLLARWLNESQTRFQYTEIAGMGHSSQGVSQ
jgi:putative membrane protein